MKMKMILMTVASSAIMLSMVGCAKAPQKEMNDAKAALESARMAEADKYVPASFSAANESLTVALAEIEKENAKNALSRNFEPAKKKLLVTKAMADEAKIAVESEKAKISQETAANIEKVNADIKKIKEMLGAKASGYYGPDGLYYSGKGKKLSKADKTACEAACKEAETLVTEASAAVQSNDITGAHDKSVQALAKVSAAKGKLSAPDKKAEKVSKSKGKRKK
jgi:hypothetical protein